MRSIAHSHEAARAQLVAASERERASQEPAAPSPLDLCAFLPHACQQLQLPFRVHVHVQLQDEYVSPIAETRRKKNKTPKALPASRAFESSQKRDAIESSAASSSAASADATVELTLVHDAGGALVELALLRSPRPPRALLKLLALCAPFHPTLERLTARWSPLAGDALHEVTKLAALAHITEVCLDDSPVPEGNHYLLLEEPARLRSLSLARCRLGDRACAPLAARLKHPLPASLTLRALSLSSDHIADAGAAALADALRSNRALRHLDLSGNRITDEGADALLGALTEFPLTCDELIARRRRLLDRLRERDELARKHYEELAAARRPSEDRSRVGKRRPTSARGRGPRVGLDSRSVGLDSRSVGVVASVDRLAAEAVDVHRDPFAPEETETRDGRVFSPGNWSLCALNLAYNELGVPSAARLAAVLRRQAARGSGGLLRVVLDGNALPVSCAELRAAQALLERALDARAADAQKQSAHVRKSKLK